MNADNHVQFKLYTLKDLKGILKVSERSLHTYIKDGRLKAVKIGGKWKVSLNHY